MKKVRVEIEFRPEDFRVIREAARFWRQRLPLFIRLAVEFRAADVLNSGPTVPLLGRDRAAFRKIWEISREPGPLERIKSRGNGITGGGAGDRDP